MFKQVLLLSFIVCLPSLSFADFFSEDCVKRSGTSTGATFAALGANEAEDARKACYIIRTMGQFSIVGDVRSMAVEKYKKLENQSCNQLNNSFPLDPTSRCIKTNISYWTATCCARGLD